MVPSEQQLCESDCSCDGTHQSLKEITPEPITLIVRHIPCRYKFSDAMHILDRIGLKGTYDFFYIPMNATKRANLGYFFVNFIKPEYAAKCKYVLDGHVFEPQSSHKRCEVLAANIQGYSNIVSLFMGHNKINGKEPPFFIKEGVPLITDFVVHRRLQAGQTWYCL